MDGNLIFSSKFMHLPFLLSVIAMLLESLTLFWDYQKSPCSLRSQGCKRKPLKGIPMNEPGCSP